MCAELCLWQETHPTEMPGLPCPVTSYPYWRPSPFMSGAVIALKEVACELMTEGEAGLWQLRHHVVDVLTELSPQVGFVDAWQPWQPLHTVVSVSVFPSLNSTFPSTWVACVPDDEPAGWQSSQTAFGPHAALRCTLWFKSPGGAVSWQLPQAPVEELFQTGMFDALPPVNFPWQYVLEHLRVPPVVFPALNV